MVDYKLSDPNFDWDRLRVRRFCLKLVYQFDWDYCYRLYIEEFINDGWSFERFKKAATYDGVWFDHMIRLEKLHNLSSFV